MTPRKRVGTPEEDIDPEKGLGTVFTPTKPSIEVVVHKPIPQSTKKQLSGEEVLDKAIGPGVYLGRGKKSRKQKRRVHKKTHKRRARK